MTQSLGRTGIGIVRGAALMVLIVAVGGCSMSSSLTSGIGGGWFGGGEKSKTEVERLTGRHLGDVGGWMKVVGVRERHPQALGDGRADGRFTGARNAHDDDW